MQSKFMQAKSRFLGWAKHKWDMFRHSKAALDVLVSANIWPLVVAGVSMIAGTCMAAWSWLLKLPAPAIAVLTLAAICTSTVASSSFLEWVRRRRLSVAAPGVSSLESKSVAMPLWASVGLIGVTVLAVVGYFSQFSNRGESSTKVAVPPPPRPAIEPSPRQIAKTPSVPNGVALEQKTFAGEREREGAKLDPANKPPARADKGVPSVGTITQGDCGVIQIGGAGNKAQGGNCAPPQRSLSTEEIGKLAAMSSIIKKTSVFCYSTDSEGCRYAGFFFRAFRDAGIEVGEMVGQELAVPIDSKVYVAIKDRGNIPKEFARAVKLLDSCCKIRATGIVDDGVPDGEIQFWIGRK